MQVRERNSNLSLLLKLKFSSICYRLAIMYFDEHNYEAAIKDLKEASAIDDRNLKVLNFVFQSISILYYSR